MTILPLQRRPRTGTAVHSLADLRPGAEATVSSISDAAPAAMARRLEDLGLAPGATVRVVRRAPLGDPVVYRVAGYDLALRRSQAAHVVVG